MQGLPSPLYNGQGAVESRRCCSEANPRLALLGPTHLLISQRQKQSPQLTITSSRPHIATKCPLHRQHFFPASFMGMSQKNCGQNLRVEFRNGSFTGGFFKPIAAND